MHSILNKLGLADENPGIFAGEWRGGGAIIEKISPVDGKVLARVRTASDEDYEWAVSRAHEAFLKWRTTPGPVRGETVRRLGNALRDFKHDLGQLVTLETGKIIAEGEGEVQEMIDICDFAVGQSRMLYGLTIQSERPSHRLMEQWHPLGVVAVISAFNFPVAVWSWNAALAAVCGDATVWKASEKTPLTAIAVTKIAERVCRETGADPAIFTLLMGDRKTVGQKLSADPRIPLISATGSVQMGLHVAQTVHGRLGKTIMELGGNNALIVAPSADIEMATQSIFFGAVGTAGQRCTAASRVIVHRGAYEALKSKLVARAEKLRIGAPWEDDTDIGPVINEAAVEKIHSYTEIGKDEGATLLTGGERVEGHGFYYRPTVFADVDPQMRIAQEEIFGPTTALIRVKDFHEAIRVSNGIKFGLSSSLFTRDVNKAFRAMRDLQAGITYINAGTIGAEVHLPFGGTKDTGNGHREAGQAALDVFTEWKSIYVDYSGKLQKAQIDTET